MGACCSNVPDREERNALAQAVGLKFALTGTRLCQVVDVIDGDTITIKTMFAGGVAVIERLRLDGINAPELHPPLSLELKTRERVIARAEESKAELTRKLGGVGAFVYVVFSKQEKFGRALGAVFVEHGEERFERSVNQWMLEQRSQIEPQRTLAVVYHGEKRGSDA